MVVPYAWLAGSADVAGQPREREVSGFGDPRFRFSVNFYGAPALSLQGVCRLQAGSHPGGQPAGLGSPRPVRPDKGVNIGTNRWSIKPELGLSKAFGPLTLELAAGVSMYTDNHDFFGGQTRAQNPSTPYRDTCSTTFAPAYGRDWT